MNNYDYMIKLIIIGDSAVGKSNVLLRFTQENFRTVHTATIGVDFKVKNIQVGNYKLKMTIWDTAGQDRFQNITTTYYKGAHGVILMYSVSDRKSFQNIQNWVKQVQQNSDKNVCKIIIGNKCDLHQSQRKISYQQGQKLCKKYNCPFFQTSAKQNINVQNAFQAIGKLVMNNIQIKNQQDKSSSTAKLNLPKKLQKKCEC